MQKKTRTLATENLPADMSSPGAAEILSSPETAALGELDITAV